MSSLSKPSTWNGKKIKQLKDNCILGGTKAKEIIAGLNSLLFWKVNVVDGQTGRVVIDDRGTVLEIPRGVAGSGVTSGLYAAGLYNNSTDYTPGAVVYTAPDSSTRIIWICEIANGPTSAVQAPTWNEPGTVYWRCYARGGSGGPSRYRVKSVQGDYLTCRAWDGTTEGGSDILVAKPPQLRHSIVAQSINGVSVTYGAFSITAGVCERTASATGYVSQIEWVLPIWQIAGTALDAEIWADTPSGGTGVVDGSSNPITLMDINRDGRAWCQVS